jgi:hypothetical protein
MTKKIKLNGKNIKTLINESLDEDNFNLSEEKIDKIIKNYLLERVDEVDNEEKTVSNTTISLLEEFESQIDDFLEEMDFINDKDGDVLLENHVYLDEKLYLLSKNLGNIKKIIESIKK